jgi:hypothetical protein
VNEWRIVAEIKWNNLSAISWRVQVTLKWDNDSYFILDQCTELDWNQDVINNPDCVLTSRFHLTLTSRNDIWPWSITYCWYL